MRVGQRITAGLGEDRDSGIIDAIVGDQITVRWDSGVVTTQSAAALEDPADYIDADGDCIECGHPANGSSKIRVNIYRAGDAWYEARCIDGEYDGCDEIDVAAGASEEDARAEVRRMFGDDVEIQRVDDVPARPH